MKKVLYLFSVSSIIILSSCFVAWSAHAQETPNYFTSFKAGSEGIPGELIVRYKKDQSPNDLRRKIQIRKDRSRNFFGTMQNTAENFGLRLFQQDLPEQQLTEVQDVEKDLGVIETEELFQDTPRADDNVLENIEVVTTQGTIPVQQLRKIYEALDNVEYVQPNYILQPLEVPNDEYYAQMWNLTKIAMPEAWNLSHGSNTVTVAIIDSGIDYAHADLPSNVIKGPDYAADDNDPKPDGSDDEGSHGTHVAGTIGALTNNTVGISGINWNVKLMAIKVFDGKDSGKSSTVIKAIKYAADNGAKVINMSLGANIGTSCENEDKETQSAIDYARSKGVVVIVAAGNSNKDAETFTPASCNGVIAVGASGPDDERAAYSNFGSIVDIAAPGGNPPYREFPVTSKNPECNEASKFPWPLCRIESTKTDGAYGLMQGTSMATPHVAGVAALLLSVKPNLTPDEVERIIKDSADPISTDKSIGGKRLNAFKALQQIASTPSPSVNPPTNTPIPPTPTPTQGLKKGDINTDNIVDIQDFAIWRCEFRGSGTCSNPPSNKKADLNKDGKVDLLDYLIWVNDFMQ